MSGNKKSNDEEVDKKTVIRECARAHAHTEREKLLA